MKCIIQALSETEFNPRAKWWGYVDENNLRHLMRYHHRWAVFSQSRILYYNYENKTDKAGVLFAIHHFKTTIMKKHTFALLKPDAMQTGAYRKILGIIENSGFRGSEFRMINKPTEEQVDAHLADLKEKNQNAYERNRGFLLNGSMLALIFVREDDLDPVEELRKIVGSTNPPDAAEGTIRSLSTDSLQKAEEENRGCHNLIHASDSPESADKEIAIWFKR